jgi:AraC-like DNA-binding protein
MERTVCDEPADEPVQCLLPQHVKRALVYTRSNVAEKITLPGLAATCAVPERILLKQFKRFVGLSPLAYLRRLRLNLARGELLKADCVTAISEIAISCGFTHLGRFATEYRRAFDESPSATGQRVRSNGAGDASLPASVAWHDKPALLIVPLRTETLQEELDTRDLMERLGATLSRMCIASVALVHPSRALSFGARRQRGGGTHYALIGPLRQVDDCTRVIARLIDVDTDRQLWGDSFDGSGDDPFALQDRVVDGVLCGVVSNITDAELGRVQSKDPKDRSARDLAMQALLLILSARLPSTLNAMTLLDRAIELDLCEPLAVALLACCHAQLAFNLGTSSPPAARAEAERLARHAALLDSGDPLVTTARAMALSMSGQCPEGHPLIARELAMDPTSTWAWGRSGFARISRGDHPDRIIADYTRA